ncbi:ABC transporter permease [Microbacterium kribbense]|uniref:ABC transporter permease n=1 Tax=Microbacterium kribbense TaxID=433645 RepID=A0ABP7GEI7_9MICO
MRRARSALLSALALPVILVAIWFAATRGETSVFVPEPISLVKTFVDVWTGPAFMEQVMPSLIRLGVGLGGSIIVGIGLGLAVGSSRVLRDLLEPVLEFFRAIPAPVLIPVLMLLIGLGDAMKITVIIIGCMWPILLNTIDGVRATDAVLIETVRSFGFTRMSRFRYLVLPAAMPRIMTGVRQSLSIGIILVVISEMFAAVSGLGYQIVLFQRTFKIPEMWSGIVLLALIGLLLAFLFAQVEKVVLRWHRGQREVENRGA